MGGVVSGCSTSNHPALVRRTGDHAMTSITTKPDSSQPSAEATVDLFDNWFDPIETGVRERVREFIHALIEGELDMSLSRPRYARGDVADTVPRLSIRCRRWGGRNKGGVVSG